MTNAHGTVPVTGTDYTTSFTVHRSPQEAYAAINDVRGWWSGGEIEGGTDKLGDEFTYRVEGIHYSKQKVTELIPGKRIVWLVTEADLTFVDDGTEWKGTKITFDIAEKGDETEVRFTHLGLAPAFECYDACSNAWSSLVNGDLRNSITTGRGSRS